jgi:hypothetical protein
MTDWELPGVCQEAGTKGAEARPPRRFTRCTHSFGIDDLGSTMTPTYPAGKGYMIDDSW